MTQTASYGEEVAERLEYWDGRIRNLRLMAETEGVQSQAMLRSSADELESLVRAVRRHLEALAGRPPQAWVEAKPRIDAALYALQARYNAVLADWPHL